MGTIRNTAYKVKVDSVTQAEEDSLNKEDGSIIYNSTSKRFKFGVDGGTQTLGKLGWEHHSDGLGSTATQVFSTTPALLSIDSLGSTTELTYTPAASGALWDTNKITPLVVGDAYHLRVDLNISAKTGNADIIKMELDIGGSTYGSAIIIAEADSVIGIIATPYRVSFVLPIFCLDTFLANGGQLWFSTDAGTVTATTRSIFIVKDF